MAYEREVETLERGFARIVAPLVGATRHRREVSRDGSVRRGRKPTPWAGFHTFQTYKRGDAFRAGTQRKAVQRWLPSSTLDTYVDLLDEALPEPVPLIAELGAVSGVGPRREREGERGTPLRDPPGGLTRLAGEQVERLTAQNKKEQFGQGTGMDEVLRDHFGATVSEEELERERGAVDPPLRTREELAYYRIFRDGLPGVQVKQTIGQRRSSVDGSLEITEVDRRVQERRDGDDQRFEGEEPADGIVVSAIAGHARSPRAWDGPCRGTPLYERLA